MTEYSAIIQRKKNNWVLAACIAAVVALGLIIFHGVQQKAPGNLFSGNSFVLPAAYADSTYRLVKYPN